MFVYTARDALDSLKSSPPAKPENAKPAVNGQVSIL
jgi:hypothetical protein